MKLNVFFALKLWREITVIFFYMSMGTGCTSANQSPDGITPSAERLQTINPDDSHVLMSGRVQINADGYVSFGYPGVSFTFEAVASEINVIGSSSDGENHFDIFIDEQLTKSVTLPKKPSNINLFKSDQPKSIRLKLVHNNETWQGVATIRAFTYNGELLPQPDSKANSLMVIGDSITCGEAVARPKHTSNDCIKNSRWWNSSNSYGMILGGLLNAETQLICYGGRGLVRSWNGATNEVNGPDFYTLDIPSDNYAKVWNQSNFEADIIVIALGTNDFNVDIGPFPEQEHFVETYIGFVQRILQDHPSAQIFITDGAMVNNEQKPQKTVLQLYLKAVKNGIKDDRVHLAFATYHAGDKCDAHPTANQHKMIAEELHQIILPVID